LFFFFLGQVVSAVLSVALPLSPFLLFLSFPLRPFLSENSYTRLYFLSPPASAVLSLVVPAASFRSPPVFPPRPLSSTETIILGILLLQRTCLPHPHPLTIFPQDLEGAAEAAIDLSSSLSQTLLLFSFRFCVRFPSDPEGELVTFSILPIPTPSPLPILLVVACPAGPLSIFIGYWRGLMLFFCLTVLFSIPFPFPISAVTSAGVCMEVLPHSCRCFSAEEP